MGVIHKLKSEVIKFILDKKQANPLLGCRDITALLLEKFQVEVSKSSINAILKANNLSMPAGRRQKPKRKKLNLPALPVMEGVKAIMLVEEPKKPVQSPEEAAEKLAIKLQEEERIRVENKLKSNLSNQVRIQKEPESNLVRQANQAEQERLANETVAKCKNLRHSERSPKGEAKNLEADEILRSAVGLPQDDGSGILQQSPNETKELESSQVRAAGVVCSGAILLKAIDCLIGGSQQINEVICKSAGNSPKDFIALTEAVIFRPLIGKDNLALLCSLVGQQISQEKLDNYYLEIKQNPAIRLDIARIISNVFTEARGVKVSFTDGSFVYLDGQLHTAWSTPYLPYDFASSAYDLKNNLNKYFFQGQPLVLLSAPGSDAPTKDFFNLLLNISSPTNGPKVLTLYGNKLEELEMIALNSQNKYSLVFGLWPWQFTGSRKIKKIGDFNSEHIEGVDKDFYLAEIEIDLVQPLTNQSVTLHGCAVKTDLQEKIRVVILSSDPSLVNLSRLARIYLNRWPNLDEGFRDFSRKVEVFTYGGGAQNFFSIESFGLNTTETNLESEEIFANYIKILDAYLRWYFLPAGYIEKDFSFTNVCFYKAQAKLTASQARVTVEMQIGQEKLPLKDSEYFMRQLNERQINSSNGQVFYFENAFK